MLAAMAEGRATSLGLLSPGDQHEQAQAGNFRLCEMRAGLGDGVDWIYGHLRFLDIHVRSHRT